MRAFFGGHIKQELRGDLAAVVVSREQTGQEKGPWYNVFLYPVLSEEFIHLTGVMDVKNSVERAYIGISNQAGNQIAFQVNGMGVDTTDLRSIDSLVVAPHFLDKYLDKPQRVVLESTPDGYKVAEAK